jgi:KDO2-lipid IV(A) lauroyltransferase
VFALAWLLARLPRGACAFIGVALGFLAGSVLRIRRAHVVSAMRRAGVRDPSGAASAMYRSLGQSAVEFLVLSATAHRAATEGTAPALSADIDCHSAKALARARSVAPPRRRDFDHAFDSGAARASELGRGGVVLAASHTGNWDYAACAVATRMPLVVVTKRLSAARLDRFWQGTRAAFGVELVEGRGALTHGKAALDRGASVAMMIDQVPMREAHALRLPFLGADALVDRAPFALAARTRAPLLVVASRRRGFLRHELVVLDVLEVPPRAARDWIDSAAARATAALERFVLANPSEWLWMHRRWRAPRPGTRRGGERTALPLPKRSPPPRPRPPARPGAVA